MIRVSWRALRVRALLLCAALAVGALGCAREPVQSLLGQDALNRSASAIVLLTETDLIAGAGQGWPATGTDVGSVSVSQSGSKLLVTYTVDPGMGPLNEVHLDIGNVPAAFDQGVSFGLFPWKATALPTGAMSYTFTIPVSGTYPKVTNGYRTGKYNFGGAGVQLYITAHAVVGATPGTPPSIKEVVVCDGRAEGVLGSYPVVVGDMNDNYEAGTLEVTLSGGSLYFSFTAADNCSTLTSKSLQLSTSDDIAWPPADWDYQDLDGGSDSIVVPLSALGIPDCAASCDAPSVALYFAYYVELDNSCDGNSYSGTAFSSDCDESYIAGQPNETCRLQFADADSGEHIFVNLYQGRKDNDRGDGELWLDDDGMLWVKATVPSGKLTEVLMFIGTGVPPNNAGAWNFHSGPLANVGSYTFGPIDLSQFGVGCGFGCEGSNLDTLNFGLHTVDNGETSTGWGCGRVSLKVKGALWKSYDPCVLTFECVTEPLFYCYCGFVVPECTSHIEYVQDPGTPPTAGETAMGLDKDNDGVSANEPGWFPNMYPSVQRWGWTFRSPRAI